MNNKEAENCKGCSHLEHVEGVLLSESEYTCTASVLDTRPSTCPLTPKKVKVLHLEITSCVVCPYVHEGTTDLRCSKTMEFLCKTTISEFVKLKTVHKDCPLEDL